MPFLLTSEIPEFPFPASAGTLLHPLRPLHPCPPAAGPAPGRPWRSCDSLCSSYCQKPLSSSLHPYSMETERLPLEQCAGRFLAKDIFAPMDNPPFDRDGYFYLLPLFLHAEGHLRLRGRGKILVQFPELVFHSLLELMDRPLLPCSPEVRGRDTP